MAARATVIVTGSVQRALAIALVLLAASPLTACRLGDGDEPGARAADARQSDQVGGPAAASTRNTTRLGGPGPVHDAAAVGAAVFPATSAATRPKAVALVDAADWHAGLAAAMLAAEPVGAPVLLTERGGLPDVTRGALARLAPSGSPQLGGAQVVSVGANPASTRLRGHAIAGRDPYELGAAVDRYFSQAKGELSKQVVIVSAERPEFAMPAAAWAARSGDSILFTAKEEVPLATVRAIQARRQPQIFVLGPEQVIGRGAERQLAKLGRVRRIAGPTPEETAVAFARFEAPGFGWGVRVPGSNFALASTARPLDAAAAAALGTNGVFAPLLVTSAADELSPALENYLLDLQPGYEEDPREGVFNRVWILGDERAVSHAVQGRIDEISQLVPVDRPRP